MTAAISSNTKVYSPLWNFPRLITMSISSAPSFTANFVSAIFTLRGAWPLGKAVLTLATFTPLAPSAFFATLTNEG